MQLYTFNNTAGAATGYDGFLINSIRSRLHCVDGIHSFAIAQHGQNWAIANLIVTLDFVRKYTQPHNHAQEVTVADIDCAFAFMAKRYVLPWNSLQMFMEDAASLLGQTTDAQVIELNRQLDDLLKQKKDTQQKAARHINTIKDIDASADLIIAKIKTLTESK